MQKSEYNFVTGKLKTFLEKSLAFLARRNGQSPAELQKTLAQRLRGALHGTRGAPAHGQHGLRLERDQPLVLIKQVKRPRGDPVEAAWALGAAIASIG